MITGTSSIGEWKMMSIYFLKSTCIYMYINFSHEGDIAIVYIKHMYIGGVVFYFLTLNVHSNKFQCWWNLAKNKILYKSQCCLDILQIYIFFQTLKFTFFFFNLSQKLKACYVNLVGCWVNTLHTVWWMFQLTVCLSCNFMNLMGKLPMNLLWEIQLQTIAVNSNCSLEHVRICLSI